MDLERQIKTTRSCPVNGDDPGVQSPHSGMTRPDFGTASRPARALRSLAVFLVALASAGSASAQTVDLGGDAHAGGVYGWRRHLHGIPRRQAPI